MKCIVAAAAVLVLSTVSATADDLVPLGDAEGRVVRVWAPDRVQGILTDYDERTIAVRLPTGDVRSFDRATVHRMKVAGRGTMFYVAIGASGAAGGALLGYGLRNFCLVGACPSYTRSENAVAMLGGAAVGALAVVLPVRLAKGWGDEVDAWRRTTAVVVPVRRGIAVMVRVGF